MNRNAAGGLYLKRSSVSYLNSRLNSGALNTAEVFVVELLI